MSSMLNLRVPKEDYRGRICGSAPGTHAALGQLVDRHVDRSRRVAAIDFGANSGALLLRLRDLGYSELTGSDLDSRNFDVEGASFQTLDLNEPFAHELNGTRFDLLTATDVIEHLESPRLFLREARKLLSDGGYIGITTPNVGFFEGRIKFMLTGELWGFSEKSYRAIHHITPVTDLHMALMMAEVGFEMVASTTGGSFASPLRKAITSPLWVPLRAMFGPKVLGESAVYLARKVPLPGESARSEGQRAAALH